MVAQVFLDGFFGFGLGGGDAHSGGTAVVGLFVGIVERGRFRDEHVEGKFEINLILLVVDFDEEVGSGGELLLFLA